MTRYIALLPGINVNEITIAMADLAAVFHHMGFTDVKTVLAQGSVAFDIASPPADKAAVAEVRAHIDQALAKRFDYEAEAVLVDAESLDRIVRAYAFDDHHDGWHSYVMFSADPAPLSELAGHAKELDAADERIELGHGVLYWEVRKATGSKSVFSKKSGKLKYRAATTTRHLTTLTKLLEATPS